MNYINPKHSSATAIKKFTQEHSRWSKEGIEMKDTAGPFACQRLRKPVFLPEVEATFRISKSDHVYAIGSCFARGIEKALHHRGFEVESMSSDFNQFEVSGGKVTALGFMNKYTTFSILNELTWALDPSAKFPEESLVDLDDKRCIDPHINPTLTVVDHAGTLDRRRIITNVTQKIRNCRVLFLTLGLVEVWYDTQTNLYLNSTPTKEILELYPDRYEFQCSNYPQNMENLEKLYELLTTYGHPDLHIVVTTSPVPLQATFTGQDIVVANTYSKSTLRVVAQDWAARHDNVQYFPSYEIVMNSARDLAWDEDLRHVQGGMTNQIMDFFVSRFVEGDHAPQGTSPDMGVAPTRNAPDKNKDSAGIPSNPNALREGRENMIPQSASFFGKSISYLKNHGLVASVKEARRRLLGKKAVPVPVTPSTSKEPQKPLDLDWELAWRKTQVDKGLSNIFIIGCPRSGTSALSWAMAEHPALWTSAESDILLYLLRTPWFFEHYQRAVASQENRVWLVKHKVSYAEFASYIGKGLDLMFRSRSGDKIWIDATPAYTTVVSELMVYFPQAKFIHIIRDGRAVVNSMLTSGFAGAEFNDFELACKAWVHYVNKGLNIMRQFPDCVHEIRNENLVADSEKEFGLLYQFLGLEPCPESVTFIRTKRINSSYLNVEKSDIKKAKDPSLMPKEPWKNWTAENQKLFIKIAGETMTMLGYDLNF
ncbi:MAG: GSCFA domain-containing protein [Anaerolineales bacterium]